MMELHVFGLVSLMVRAVVHNVGDTCDRGSVGFLGVQTQSEAMVKVHQCR